MLEWHALLPPAVVAFIRAVFLYVSYGAVALWNLYVIILPHPDAAVKLPDAGDFFSHTSESLHDAMMEADQEAKYVAVVAYSALHPDSDVLLTDLARSTSEMASVAANFVRIAVRVSAQDASFKVPAALRNCANLPAVAVYSVGLPGKSVSLLALAQGVSKATTVEAFFSECLKRYPLERPVRSVLSS